MRDLSTLKVVELKEELRKRGLKVGGLKRDLVKRLHEYLENEEHPTKGHESDEDEIQIVEPEPIKIESPPVSSTTDDILRDKKAFSPVKNRRKKNKRESIPEHDFVILVDDPPISDDEQTQKKPPTPQKPVDPPSPYSALSLVTENPLIPASVNYSKPKTPKKTQETSFRVSPEKPQQPKRTTRLTKPPPPEPKPWEHDIPSPPLPFTVQNKPSFPLLPFIALVSTVAMVTYTGILHHSSTLQFAFIAVSLVVAVLMFLQNKETSIPTEEMTLQKLKDKKAQLSKYLGEVDRDMRKLQESLDVCVDGQKRKVLRNSIVNYKNMIHTTSSLYEEVEHKVVFESVKFFDNCQDCGVGRLDDSKICTNLY